MKKNFLFKKSLFGGLLVIFSIIGIFYACSKKDVLVLEDKKESSIAKNGDKSQDSDRLPKKLFLKDFMWIGEKHNEGLDFILREALANRHKGHKGGFGLDFIVNSALKFVSQDDYLKKQVAVLEKMKIEYTEGAKELMQVGSRKCLLNSEHLNPKQKQFALAILDLAPINYEDLYDKIQNIISQVQNSTLSVEEQYPLFVMASVALKSAEYWVNRESLWNTVFNPNYQTTKLDEFKIESVDFSWVALMGNDAIGAISFAGYGFAVASWASALGGAVIYSGTYFCAEHH